MNNFNLKYFRQSYNISQKHIVELTGLSQGYVSEIEKGIKKLPEQAFDKLYKKYGSKLDYFIDDTTKNEDIIHALTLENLKLKMEIKLLKNEILTLKK